MRTLDILGAVVAALLPLQALAEVKLADLRPRHLARGRTTEVTLLLRGAGESAACEVAPAEGITAKAEGLPMAGLKKDVAAWTVAVTVDPAAALGKRALSCSGSKPQDVEVVADAPRIARLEILERKSSSFEYAFDLLGESLTVEVVKARFKLVNQLGVGGGPAIVSKVSRVEPLEGGGTRVFGHTDMFSMRISGTWNLGVWVEDKGHQSNRLLAEF